MGADLFESYVGSIIAACTLAPTVVIGDYSPNALYALPFWLAGVGIICSIIGIQFVSVEEQSGMRNKESNEMLERLLHCINYGIKLAAVLFVICAGIICYVMLANSPNTDLWWKV
jgi:Na+/H+-translocating membrane pyrophosphatase